MPQTIPLQAIPSQSFTITLDNNLWNIAIRTCNGVTAVSLTLNGTLLIDNLIAASCAPIIPCQYQENGNFLFLTTNQQLPVYSQFNVTQSLLYFSPSELEVFRVAPVASSPKVPTVTAQSFNPLGSLPLRFVPQGYVLA